MCGIAGFTSPGLDAPEHLRRMLGMMWYRGPDGSGAFQDANLALGHLRLAIVDVAGGAQPRVDGGTGDVLAFNGEVYGFRELADELRASLVTLRDDSDTEVLFQLIRRMGVRRAVERISGMFAFAYRDGASGALYLVRDRFGEKPLYYGMAGGQLVFGSEAGVVLAHPAFHNAAPDRLAAYMLLQFEFVPGRASGWAGIEKVPPGTILRFADGQVSLDRYWRPHVGVALCSTPEEEAVPQLDSLLRSAIRKQLVADVPVGVFLSGGLDSSLITALAAEMAPDITAFTVRVGGHSFDETAYAAEAAAHIGVRHDIVEFADADLLEAFDAMADHLTEPLADSSLLPTWLVCRAARRSMTVALGGDGADELFAGYPNFPTQSLAAVMQHIPRFAGTAVSAMICRLGAGSGYMNWQFLLSQLAQGFGHPPHRQSSLWMAPFGVGRMSRLWASGALPVGLAEKAFHPVDEAAADADTGSSLDRLLHQFLVTYLPDDILMKTDRAAMFNSLEVRAPFLDVGVAEYACSLPGELKLRGRQRKYALKQVARRYLPDHLVDRKKHGFAVPIGHVLRTLLRERCCDILLSRQSPVANWFRREEIETMLGQHMSCKQDHGKRLWALLLLFVVTTQRSGSALVMSTPCMPKQAVL